MAPSHPVQPQAGSDNPHVISDSSSIFINPQGRLRIEITFRPKDRMYQAEMSLDGIRLCNSVIARTSSRVLLEASKLAAEGWLLKLHTPHVPDMGYRLDIDAGWRALTLPRPGLKPYVIMATVRRGSSGQRGWHGFCNGYHTGLPFKQTSFKALVDIVGYMIEAGIWP